MFLLKKIFLYGYVSQRVVAAVKYFYLQEKKVWKIGEAGIKGQGMYASRRIPQGSVVFVASGSVEYWRSESAADADENPNWYNVAENIWIDMQYPYVKANHSCEPNVGIDGSRIFVALRDIAEGEEITFDYSITDIEECWEMPCACDAPDCRQVVTSITRVPEKYYLKSHPYIPPFIQKVYQEKRGQTK